MGRKKKYFTEEERLTVQRETKRRWRVKHPEYDKQYRQEHKEEKAEYNRQYRVKHPDYGKQYQQEHKEERAEWQRQYNKTPIGRAYNLLTAYKQSDKMAGRGECTLTSKWIIDNIFPKPCHWCGEVGWEIMGCDRINNELPHTPDNVIPCCDACNKKRGTKTYEEYLETLRADEMTL